MAVLDREDRGVAGVVLLVVALVLVAGALLGLAAGIAVRIFLLVSGLG